MPKPNALAVVNPGTTDRQVLEAYRAAEQSMAELLSSPQFKSTTRKQIISGLLLAEKKAELGHGNFIPWCDKHSVSRRTASYHMEIATSACGVLQMGNGCPFENLPLHRLIELPFADLPKEAVPVREKFDALIENNTSKEIVTEFKDEQGSKPERANHDIKFHCPHCGEKNKGKHNRTIKCVKCKREIKVKPDGLSAEEKIQQIIKGEQEMAENLIASIEQWRLREHRKEAGRALLERLESVRIDLGKDLKKLIKGKRSESHAKAQSRKEGEK